MKIQKLELQKFEVEAINTIELESISGGNPWIAGMAAAWLGTIIYETVNDWEKNVAAFNSGYNSVRNTNN